MEVLFYNSCQYTQVLKKSFPRSTKEKFPDKILPSLNFDVRNSIEVSGQVVLIHHGRARGRSQQFDSEVSDGKEVPQVFCRVKLSVQGSHIVQTRSGEQGESVFDLKAYRLVILPHVSPGVFLRADNVQKGVLGQILRRPGLHGEGVQTVCGIKLVGLPSSAIIEGLLQDHLLRAARLERYDDVICQLNGFVPGEGDVDQQWLGEFPPRGRLPERGGVATFKVKHQFWGVCQLFCAGVTLIITHIRVFLKKEEKAERQHIKTGYSLS